MIDKCIPHDYFVTSLTLNMRTVSSVSLIYQVVSTRQTSCMPLQSPYTEDSTMHHSVLVAPFGQTNPDSDRL